MHSWGYLKLTARLTLTCVWNNRPSMFTGWMAFLPPNQQHQSAEGTHRCCLLHLCQLDSMRGFSPWLKRQTTQVFIYLLMHSVTHEHAHIALFTFAQWLSKMPHFGYGELEVEPMTPKFELWQDICTMHLVAKFHHLMFNGKEVIMLTNTQATENIHLASLCFTSG